MPLNLQSKCTCSQQQQWHVQCTTFIYCCAARILDRHAVTLSQEVCYFQRQMTIA
jgi:hypothetical protein